MRVTRPVLVAAAAVTALTGCTSTLGTPHPLNGFARSSQSSYSDYLRVVRVVPSAPVPSAPVPTVHPTRTTPHRHPPPQPTPTRVRTRHRTHAAQLPLAYSTGSARQVITVVANAESDTQGTVQAWRRVPGGWHRVGPAVPAYLGTDGMTPNPSESVAAVPMGSWTITQAFGHDANPGTQLPYRETTPSDWWISEAGPYYNTEQHCAGSCPFTQGAPNEHLYYETPYYDYAAVIDYNTSNAPGGVRQGAGSAFFLHVAVGAPTAGCVSIDVTDLVRLLRWLRPAEHPRIVIGTS